jgi:hypothetical protein
MSDGTDLQAVVKRKSGFARISGITLILLAATCVSTTALLQVAEPAVASPIADCSTTVGEIVVVDFSHWGGPIDRGCATTLSTGYNAMYEAGFITQGTQEDGSAFICRIGLSSEGSSSYEPTPSEDSCVDTPPATAYWSYWHADAGQNTWSYSQQGAMDYIPPPGSVDAWVFGATNLSGTTGGPTFPPSAVRATNTSPTATTTTVPPSTVPPSTATPTSTKTTSPTTPTSSDPPTRIAPKTGVTSTSTPKGDTPTTSRRTTASKTAGAQGDQSDTTTTDPPEETQSGTGHQPKIVNISSSAIGRLPPGGGPPLSFEIGAGIVALLVVAGGLLAWRRRRSNV